MAPIFTGSKFGFGSKVSRTNIASGGNIDSLEPGNGYVYHTFTSPGTFTLTPTSTLSSIEILVIGGGGGGGNYASGGNSGGGGGAGGLVYYSSFPVTAGTAYTVGVGTGGLVATVDTPGTGSNGQQSTFGGVITALGGGGGAGYATPAPGTDVGSGGGGGGYIGANASADQPVYTQPVPGFLQYGGNGGSFGGPSNPGNSAGGGGAGGNGGSAPTGVGGNGRQYSQFEGSLIGLPSLSPFSGFFAGGGAGRNQSTYAYGAASAGGGGNYPGPTIVRDGASYTGGGGAGGAGNSPPVARLGGNGGPGIVVVRYAA